MDKPKQDAFLILRISLTHKEHILKMATKSKLSLSAYVRKLIEYGERYEDMQNS